MKYGWLNMHEPLECINGPYDTKEAAFEAAVKYLKTLPEDELDYLDKISMENIEDFEILILPITKDEK